MTAWPICPLCQTETSHLDEHGLCQRISITHDAVRHPDEYPVEHHPELWALILSGRPVFPVTPTEQAAIDRRRQLGAAA